MYAPKIALAIATCPRVLYPCSHPPSAPKNRRESGCPKSQVKTLVEKAGFTVQRIKRDNSCYEVKGKRKDGRNVELYVNPVDASIVKEEVK